MTTHDKSPFTNHEIVSRVEAEGFGSWLMKRRHKDGDWTFWVRVTAAEGLLTVVGDFNPTVFAHGPRDPSACVRWMGTQQGVTMYAAEKAGIGTGRERTVEYDTDLAAKHLRELLDDARKRRDADDDDITSSYERAIQAGLDTMVEYDGFLGVHQMKAAVLDEDPDLWEDIMHVGCRPAPSTVLAIQALNQLVKLLDAEAGATEAA